MDENRKAIIINEIRYWKKTRLLPDQYCDYLLVLYSEGNENKEKNKNIKRKNFLLVNFILLFIPISIFLIYFTELSSVLQITIFACLFVFFISVTIYLAKKNINYQLLLIGSLILLLLISVEIVLEIFSNKQSFLYVTIFINCFLWFILGKKCRFLYLQISAYLGVILLIITIFLNI